jgi:hypothetical protein
MRPLLKIMEDRNLDFHKTFRFLCNFRPTMLEERDALDAFIGELLTFRLDPLDSKEASKEWSAWLEMYAARIENEKDMWAVESDVGEVREAEMRAVNPRFVLRQWLLEEVIKIVESDHETGKRVLRKVLHVRLPFLLVDQATQWRRRFSRWLVTHSSPGVRKGISNPVTNWKLNSKKSGGIAEWELKICLVFNAVAPVRDTCQRIRDSKSQIVYDVLIQLATDDSLESRIK